MSTTITIRTEDELRRELEKRAAALGKSLSQVVRDILADAIVERPFGARASALRGSLELDPRAEDPWRRKIRSRNWRE